MAQWENLSVTIDTIWGDGGQINFGNAAIQPPQFTLQGIYLPTPSGPVLSRYLVTFNAGYMVDWWSGVSLFPLGPVDGSPLPLLAGYLGVIYDNVPRVDLVQMTYQPGAAKNPDGTTADLVLVQFSFADDTGTAAPLENGGASGPPH